jgi:Rap1a immunity proteins
VRNAGITAPIGLPSLDSTPQIVGGKPLGLIIVAKHAKKLMLVLTMALGCIQPAKAAATGMDLQQWCSAGNDGSIDGTKCFIYMLGFINGLSLAADGKVWCLPGNLTVGQSMLIVQKWMRDNPEELHQRAGIIAERAMLNAYACKKRVR